MAADRSLRKGKPGPHGSASDHVVVSGVTVKEGGKIDVMFPTGWRSGRLRMRKNGRHELAPWFEYDGGSVQLWPGRSSVRVTGS